ncbi:MAG: hypothetical protein ABIT37_06635 [Luteolibacter sp.]
MTLRIKRISPLSLTLTLGGIYFVIGCFVALFGIFGSMVGGNITLSGPFGFNGGGLGLLPLSLIYPFASFLIGGIGGYVIAVIYNFLSLFTRGLVVDTEEAGKYDSLF